ncbi:MAG: LysR family transcriptional regulator [Proteobacteria bacterium]|nr:LysR family transcriptional regulator [Pseudomonadota bacterium]
MDRLESLRFFVEISEAGSFSAVARNRVLSVSTVTQALQRLESELGVSLITRSTRRLSLTYDGQRFLADARRLLADWDSAVGGLHQHGPLQGPIYLTTPNDFGRNRLLPLLDEFMALHPGVRIQLLLSDGVVDLVEQHIDLALRTGPLPDSGLRARLLLHGPRLACAAPSYWQAHGRPRHPSELTQHNCLLLAQPGTAQIAWQFVENGKALTVKVTGNRVANDGGALREWALRGHGVVRKVKWDIVEDLEAGRLEAVLEDYVAEQINLYAVYPGETPNRRVAALIEFLASRLKS